jgi:hypothetical protein
MSALSIEEELYRDATLTITSAQVVYRSPDGQSPRVIPLKRTGPCRVERRSGWMVWSSGLLCSFGVASFVSNSPEVNTAGVALISLSAGVAILARTKAVTRVTIPGPNAAPDSDITVTFSGPRQGENADQVVNAIGLARTPKPPARRRPA